MACLGLNLKLDFDELCESPAVHIASALLSQSYDLVAVEPNIESHDQFALVSLEDALATADVSVGLVKHR